MLGKLAENELDVVVASMSQDWPESLCEAIRVRTAPPPLPHRTSPELIEDNWVDDPEDWSSAAEVESAGIRGSEEGGLGLARLIPGDIVSTLPKVLIPASLDKKSLSRKTSVEPTYFRPSDRDILNKGDSEEDEEPAPHLPPHESLQLAVELAQRIALLFKMNALPESATVDDFIFNSDKNLAKIKKSPAYEDFCSAICRLRLVNLDLLTDHDERLCFFLNIRNALILQVHVEAGIPSWRNRLMQFYHKPCYDIGGHLFSVNDITHGVLRGGMKLLSFVGSWLLPICQFDEDDPRYKSFVLRVASWTDFFV